MEGAGKKTISEQDFLVGEVVALRTLEEEPTTGLGIAAVKGDETKEAMVSFITRMTDHTRFMLEYLEFTPGTQFEVTMVFPDNHVMVRNLVSDERPETVYLTLPVEMFERPVYGPNPESEY